MAAWLMAAGTGIVQGFVFAATAPWSRNVCRMNVSLTNVPIGLTNGTILR
jgi:hypothetical protein